MRLNTEKSATHALISVDRRAAVDFYCPFKVNSQLQMEVPANGDSVWQRFLVFMVDDLESSSWENDKVNVASQVKLNLEFIKKEENGESGSDSSSNGESSATDDQEKEPGKDSNGSEETKKTDTDITKSRKNFSVTILGLGGIMILLVIVVVAMACVCVRRQRRRKEKLKKTFGTGHMPRTSSNQVQRAHKE